LLNEIEGTFNNYLGENISVKEPEYKLKPWGYAVLISDK